MKKMKDIRNSTAQCSASNLADEVGTQQTNSTHTAAKVRILTWKNMLSPPPQHRSSCKPQVGCSQASLSEGATAPRTHNGTEKQP